MRYIKHKYLIDSAGQYDTKSIDATRYVLIHVVYALILNANGKYITATLGLFGWHLHLYIITEKLVLPIIPASIEPC